MGITKNPPVWPKSPKSTRILPKFWGSFFTFKIFGEKWFWFGPSMRLYAIEVHEKKIDLRKLGI